MYNIDDIKNTVIHGDSEIELLKIPDESIDCVIIDPPYNLLKHKLDRAFDRELIYKELYRVLKNNSFLAVFGSGLQLCKDIVMLNKIGFKVKEEVIWVKESPANFMNNLPRRHESFYILSKGNKPINKCYVDMFKKFVDEDTIYKLKENYIRIVNKCKKEKILKEALEYMKEGAIIYNNMATKYDITTSKNTPQQNRIISYLKTITQGYLENTCMFVNKEHYQYKHGTQKPLELMSRIVKLVSNEDDIILDCFAGSGSTLLGAIKNNRNYIGIEIDKEYYDICCDRIKEKQGLFAGV